MLVAAVFGCLILLLHSTLTFMLFFIYRDDFGDDVAIAEISIPITLAYAMMVVKWVVVNKGHIRKRPTVGITYVIALAIVFVSFIGALVAGPALYLWSGGFSATALNTYFAVADGAFGALMLLFLNDLFGPSEKRT